MACFDADGPEPGGHQVPVQPFRKWAGFQAHHVDLILPNPKLLNERTWFAVYFALPDELTVEVQHAQAVFCREMSRPTTVRMAHSVSKMVGREPSEGKRLTTDYPISRASCPPTGGSLARGCRRRS